MAEWRAVILTADEMSTAGTQIAGLTDIEAVEVLLNVFAKKSESTFNRPFLSMRACLRWHAVCGFGGRAAPPSDKLAYKHVEDLRGRAAPTWTVGLLTGLSAQRS